MKSFFIALHEDNKSDSKKYIVESGDVKSEILKTMNIKGLDIDKYDFYDESDLEKESKFVEMYHDAIFETYFPRVKEGNIYVYYPKPKVIETSDSTIYVNRWDEIDVSGIDVQSVSYISDDSDKEEHQRVMTIFMNNKTKQTESKECEQAE